MIKVPPIPFIRRKRQASSPAPAALVLVAAEWDPGFFLWLTFDRAIDISAIDPTQFIIRDGAAEMEYAGAPGAAHGLPGQVEIPLLEAGPWSGAGITLSATAENGIIAVDGAPWAGVSELALPWP